MTTRTLHIEYAPLKSLLPYANNARVHSRKQIRQIAASIERFGFTNPVLIDDNHGIIAGHGRVSAAKQLGMAEVPVVRLSHMTAAERRAYILADNKLALNAGWDQDLLAIELQGLIDLNFEVELTGFSVAEIDLALDAANDRSTSKPKVDADALPSVPDQPVTRPGDVWQLGRHRLICADARSVDSYSDLLGNETVDLIFADPPYNIPVAGFVSGHGKVRHDDFIIGAGEMSADAFTAFLTESLGEAANSCRDGAIAFVCMDWRHMGEMMAAGSAVFSELKNLCVWNKTNGGLGSFYRSKHELVFVYKIGEADHVNNFKLGTTGRHRTNVWDYAGVNAGTGNRQDMLAMHPTVKPVALVADAIRDCSKRNHIILDPFGGSGTTLIAAETCGRNARLIELDPRYCDVIIQRFEAFTGQPARLRETGVGFEETAEQRHAQEKDPVYA